MKVARNLFIHKVEDVPEAIQEKFTKLTNDSFAKDEFHSCKLEEFWVKMQHCSPRIGIQALNILVPFSSTYLCECGFSALLTIKSKARNRLLHYLLLNQTLKNSLLKSKVIRRINYN